MYLITLSHIYGRYYALYSVDHLFNDVIYLFSYYACPMKTGIDRYNNTISCSQTNNTYSFVVPLPLYPSLLNCF